MPIGLLVFLMLKSLDILGIHYFKKALIFVTFVAFRVLKYLSADLTKGSFRHFSSFCLIKISKTSKFSRFCMFSQ